MQRARMSLVEDTNDTSRQPPVRRRSIHCKPSAASAQSASRCPPSGRNSTYRPVQISGTGSDRVRPADEPVQTLPRGSGRRVALAAKIPSATGRATVSFGSVQFFDPTRSARPLLPGLLLGILRCDGCCCRDDEHRLDGSDNVGGIRRKGVAARSPYLSRGGPRVDRSRTAGRKWRRPARRLNDPA
jgi:hypothetical protein